jgi:cell division protein FtsQ
MRIKMSNSKRGAAVLDAPEERYEAPREIRRAPSMAALRPKRDFTEDFADDEDTAEFLRSTGRARRGRKSLLPQTRWGWIGIGTGFAVVLAGLGFAYMETARFLSHDPRFLIESSSAIEVAGNKHIQRSDLVSVFGEDLDRNIFHVPLTERRKELEGIPWVEHAKVERFLPNRLRVEVTERTPVAYVRQDRKIGMVDASGVLLDIPADVAGDPNYSFPVVTGISANDPLSTRGPRMKIYERFIQDLDSGGQKISHELSEVDMSDPEDVKALVQEGSSEILVHFGESDFLKRYQSMRENMAEWKRQYPRLTGVDMRYERQVVLQQGAGAAPAASAGDVTPAPTAPAKPVVKAPAAVKPPAKAAVPAKKNTPAAKKIDAKKVAEAHQRLLQREKAKQAALKRVSLAKQ